VLAVQILSFADDGLWGKLSALGIIMIFISTGLVMLAMFAGGKFKSRETT
jgi:iron(III) transport system permease protein